MQLIPTLTRYWLMACAAPALDDTVERKGISATELSVYFDQLTSQGQIISDLGAENEKH